MTRPRKADPPAKWKQYWADVQPEKWLEAWGYWRTEPEIDSKRKDELSRCLAVPPDIEAGRYPFKDLSRRLTRADIEWLLVTHETGRGPIDWNDASQRGREGLDLRGADLTHLNLTGLPLARLRAGLTLQERRPIEGDHVWPSEASAADFQGAN